MRSKSIASVSPATANPLVTHAWESVKTPRRWTRNQKEDAREPSPPALSETAALEAVPHPRVHVPPGAPRDRETRGRRSAEPGANRPSAYIACSGPRAMHTRRHCEALITLARHSDRPTDRPTDGTVTTPCHTAHFWALGRARSLTHSLPPSGTGRG